MITINEIAQVESLNNFSKARTDSSAIQKDVHYPTNNSLTWNCIKIFGRILLDLAEETDRVIATRRHKKQDKKHFAKIIC